MDNKITKKRLGDLCSYDWILFIAAIAAAILVWELLYAFTSVKLTTGQRFSIFYDEGVINKNETALRGFLQKDDALSFEVIVLDSESMAASTNVLSIRLQVGDGDVIFASVKPKEGEGSDKGTVRAKSIIDGGYVYNFERLVTDAEEYLKKFKNPSGDWNDEAIYENFDARLGRDNRFRSESEKTEGKRLEKERLVRLEKELADFKSLLLNEDYLFRYTRFTQTLDRASESRKAEYEEYVKIEKQNGRENVAYGLNIGALHTAEGKLNVSELVSLNGESTAENVVLMIFDFYKDQPDAQFETISFVNCVVRNCSNALPALNA